MDIDEQIKYWVTIADNDIVTAQHLFETGHFVWCLYIGHLILEKILKAHYVKDERKTPPKIHDLVKLAERTKINFTQEQKNFLTRVNNFNIEKRYPDYRFTAYKVCTKEYTEDNFKKIMEMYTWLRSQLN